MKTRSLTREEVRSIDEHAVKELGLSTLVLMENAGRGAAEYLRAQVPAGARILVVCGPGNNGGDGGVLARHLDSWEFPVRVIWFANPARLTPDAAAQFNILAKAGIDQGSVDGKPDVHALDAQLADADWVVDGLLGTGLARPVEGPLRTVIEALNRAGKPVLALDLPSGLDADTGQPQGVAVRATMTVTFVGPKQGFSQPGAEAYTGPVRVVEIGVPRRLMEGFRGI